MTRRQIAQITIEADTPLKVGSANSDFLQDSPIQRDWNGLPMILGTSIAGVLRKDFEGNDDDIFGKDDGSKVIFSNALLLDEHQKVNEGLLLEKSNFLRIFDNLPLREHTAISDKGAVDPTKNAKFDEEVVYKGSRFKFSIEMLDNQTAFNELIELLQSPSFRLGGGSTKGFGKFNILEIKTETIETIEALKGYSSSLNNFNGSRVDLSTNNQSATHTKYTLKITPDDFFMFGSGFGDEETDQTPVYESVIDYKKKRLSDKQILLPASSLKGALAHRTVFHFNSINEFYIGNEKARNVITELFGEAKNSKKEINGSKGKIIFSDCFKLDQNITKIFDHVAIDRFTGGALDGALFQEKTIAQNDIWKIEILVEDFKEDSNLSNEKNQEEREQYQTALRAFEKALDDVCSGLLPLGGATTKGHGVFSGDWSKS